MVAPKESEALFCHSSMSPLTGAVGYGTSLSGRMPHKENKKQLT